MVTKQIAILGEYNPENPTHQATDAAIAHSLVPLGANVESVWITTDRIDETLFDTCMAVLIAPGSPYRSMSNVLWAIKTARQNGIPCLGTCGGFQHMVIEYARNVLGIEDAQHAEYDPDASVLFISRLACSLVGRAMALTLNPDSQAAAIYGARSAVEQYYCNFGVNPEFLDRLRSGPLRISGSDLDGEARIVELPGHPFFVGTLFVPQARSRPENPHPLITAFLQAAIGSGASSLVTPE